MAPTNHGNQRLANNETDEGLQNNNGDEEEDFLIANASPEELREIVAQLQLERVARKRQLAEVTRERDEFLMTQVRKRRRPPPQESTPVDVKYKTAGKRCALFWVLWLTPDLFETDVDETCSEAIRYIESEPGMQIQGERQDMLSSMAEGLIQDFDDEEHFRKVHPFARITPSQFGDALGEQRRTTASRVRTCGSLSFGCSQDLIKNTEFRTNHEDFKELLGFQAEEEITSRRWPALAPVLYIDGQTKNSHKAFRSAYIKNVFRSYMFGPSSVEGSLERNGGPKVLAGVLCVMTITVGAIAAAATLTRWAISPDVEFRPVGPTTAIQWRADYNQYKKLLIKSLQAEKDRYNRTKEISAYTKLLNE
ncbi:hypothetical protein BDV93DRAFT_563359 [Ceratobasidium sp. AG-I]|nr:hypothetical protein BDV93DRAFT_563359 [Ceratobasidium sp. AG-I]